MVPKPREALLAALAAAIVCDALPPWIPIVGALGDVSHAMLRPFGLWQGNWSLFAPDPKRDNRWLEVQVRFEDGSQASWRSPERPVGAPLQAIADGRWTKVVENAARSDQPALHEGLTRWAARRVASDHPQAPPVHARLVRHLTAIAPPMATGMPLPEVQTTLFETELP